jgi:hypothetical protein
MLRLPSPFVAEHPRSCFRLRFACGGVGACAKYLGISSERLTRPEGEFECNRLVMALVSTIKRTCGSRIMPMNSEAKAKRKIGALERRRALIDTLIEFIRTHPKAADGADLHPNGTGNRAAL